MVRRGRHPTDRGTAGADWVLVPGDFLVGSFEEAVQSTSKQKSSKQQTTVSFELFYEIVKELFTENCKLLT